MYGRERMPEVTNAGIYTGGLLDKWGGHIHPLNLVLGEAKAFEGLGGRIFEQSRGNPIDRDAAKPVVSYGGAAR
jgi:gamma-glutamylputrescine oxidase